MGEIDTANFVEFLFSRTFVNKGKKKGRRVVAPVLLEASYAFSCTGCGTKPLDDARHLFAVVGAKRQGPEVPRRAKFEQHCTGALIVGGFDYCDQVVGADGPIDLLDCRSILLGECVGLFASVHGIPCSSHPLVGPVHQDDVGGHPCLLLPPV